MGIIRGGLTTLVTVLLFISLLSLNSFLTLSMSLEYETIEPNFVSVMDDSIRENNKLIENLDGIMVTMQVFCENRTDFTYTSEGHTFNFPCEVIENGSAAVLEYAILDLVKENYYKEYNCEFWECSITPPFHFISKMAQDYWSGWFYYFLLASIILAALLVLFLEDKTDMPLIVGFSLIIASLPFVKIEWLLSLLGSWSFVDFFKIFFVKSYNVFLISFIIGIVFLGVTLVLKGLVFGKFLKKVFGKDPEKEALKEEIKEEIKEESSKKKSSKK